MRNGRRYSPGLILAALFALAALLIPAPAARADSAPGAPRMQSGADDYLGLLEHAFRSITRNYVDRPEAKKLFEGAMKGLLESLGDPHSYYLPQDELKELTDTTRGSFGGVGLIISKPGLTAREPTGASAKARAEAAPLPALPGAGSPPYVEVVSPIRGTPAYRAGISAGDRLTAIDKSSTASMTIEQVVNRLRGEPGTRVTLSVLRGSRITFDITLERAVVDVPVVKSALIAPHIGYLQIIEYTPFTPKRVRTALESLLRDGATSLIVDERGNPGGLLNAVVATCDYFLANGTIVSIRSRVASGETVYSATPSTLLPASFPLIVLIDRGSASAAEIFAGAMQDHHRALLVGETSFGKGSVQEVFFLPRGDGAFKLTTARYYTPRGRNIDKVGIEPDVEVKEPEPTQRDQEDLERLIENNTIVNFVRTQPGAGPAKIATFIAQLRAEGITLSTRTLERLIRNEQDRMQTNPPVYDLTYDRPLAEAVRLLRSGQYPGGAR